MIMMKEFLKKVELKKNQAVLAIGPEAISEFIYGNVWKFIL